MDAKQVAAELFCGPTALPEWSAGSFPARSPLGHSTVLWYGVDVLDFINNHKEDGDATQANGRARFRVDRMFKGVGRIAVSSGTRNEKEFRSVTTF